MIPFLPILLLGLAQIAEQSVPSPAAQPPNQSAESGVLTPKVTLGAAHQILIDHANQLEDQNLCFTMRSYLFERRNGFAPEPVGMTTCQPASARRQKQVVSRPKLVPAN